MVNTSYNKTVLDNGLTVISEHINSVRSVSVGIWIKTGSRYEDSFNNGVAHFLEHMLFKGTAKRSQLQIAQSLESLGGSLNAFTSREITCYYANVMDIYFKKAVEVLSDMICNSIFPDKEIEREKNVIIEEINAVKDTPEEYIFDIFQENLFPDDSLGRPILGTPEKIKNLRKSDITEFWNLHYSPENIIISAAGNLNHKRLIQYTQKFFSFKNTGSRKAVSGTRINEGNQINIKQPINQAHLCIGRESISYTSDERFPLLVLNTYLGGGMSSRLFQKLREKKGLAYSVYSFTDFYSDLGIFGVYIGTDPQKLKQVQRYLKLELIATKNKPISKNVLKKLKNQLKGNLVLGLENSSRRMSRLAKNEIYFNEFKSIESLMDNIDKVNEDDVQQVAAKIMNPEKFTSVIFNHN